MSEQTKKLIEQLAKVMFNREWEKAGWTWDDAKKQKSTDLTDYFIEESKALLPIFSEFVESIQYARTFVTVADVRPERLQDITPEDCKLEGVSFNNTLIIEPDFLLIDHFAILWNSTAKPGMKWEDSPWVWRYLLKRKGR